MFKLYAILLATSMNAGVPLYDLDDEYEYEDILKVLQVKTNESDYVEFENSTLKDHISEGDYLRLFPLFSF